MTTAIEIPEKITFTRGSLVKDYKKHQQAVVDEVRGASGDGEMRKLLESMHFSAALLTKQDEQPADFSATEKYSTVENLINDAYNFLLRTRGVIKGSQLSERKKQYLQALDNLFASNPNGAEKVKVLTVRDCTTFTFYIGSGRTTQLWMRVDNAELEKLKQGDQTVAVRFSRVGWDSRKARPVMPFNQLPEKYQDQILEALDKQEEN